MQHMLLSIFLTNKALGKSLIHFRERKSFYILGNIRQIIKSTKKHLKWCVHAFNYSKKGFSRTFTLLTCVWSNIIVFFQTPLLSEAHSFVRYQSSEWGIRMLFISEHKGVGVMQPVIVISTSGLIWDPLISSELSWGTQAHKRIWMEAFRAA